MDATHCKGREAISCQIIMDGKDQSYAKYFCCGQNLWYHKCGCINTMSQYKMTEAVQTDPQKASILNSDLLKNVFE